MLVFGGVVETSKTFLEVLPLEEMMHLKLTYTNIFLEKKHPKKKKVWRRFHVFKWKHHEKNKQEVVEVEVPPPIEYHSVRSCDQFEGLTLSWIVFCWVIFDPFYYHFAPHKTTLSK